MFDPLPSAPDATGSATLAKTDTTADVAIAGAGAAGAMAALVLARSGHRVTLIDVHMEHPAEFRCEKITPHQYQLFEGLGLASLLPQFATRIEAMDVVRGGRWRERIQSVEHGFLYQDFVNTLRRALPPGVRFVHGRIADIETGPELQRVHLANGDVIQARLAVLATGLGHGLRQRLGIGRRMLHERHTLCLGFTIKPSAGEAFDFPALTHYAERTADGMAHVTFFPLGATMRANLFAYRSPDDPFVAAMREQPRETLFGVMPGLRRSLGNFEVEGKLQTRMIDLYVAEDYLKDGVLLIGDAFQTSCPAAGTGLAKALSDVGRLGALLPDFLATPGMAADKLRAFYDDPVKQASDASSSRAAAYTRQLATSTALPWRLRRLKKSLRGRMNALVGD